MTEELLICICGVIAGVVNGFLGSGGGIVIIFSLALMRRYGKIGGSDRKNDFAMAVCAILPMSAISLVRYCDGGNVDFSFLLRLLVPCALGGALGAFLLGKIKLGFVKKLFAVLICISGVIMIVR